MSNSKHVAHERSYATIRMSLMELEVLLTIDAAIQARERIHERPTVFMTAVVVGSRDGI